MTASSHMKAKALIFLEPSFNVRKIQSVEWTAVDKTVPTRFPRRLDFTGRQVVVGVEFDINPKPDKTSSANRELNVPTPCDSRWSPYRGRPELWFTQPGTASQHPSHRAASGCGGSIPS